MSPTNQHMMICPIEGITRFWSFNFSIFFVVGLSILCCRSIRGHDPKQAKYALFVILFGTIICLILSLPLIWLSDYVFVKRTDLYCVISANSKNLSLPMVVLVQTLYQGIQNVICLTISITCYFLTYCYAHNHWGIRNVRMQKVKGFLLVMFLILIPDLVINYTRIGVECDQSWIAVFHLVLTHSAGTLNAIAYGYEQYAYMIERRRERLV